MELSELSKYRESNRLEAKDARGGVPKSVWESISAFANTGGGVILLGVAESEDRSLKVVGLPDASRTLEDFWNTAHNPGKLSPCVLSDDDARVEEADGKEIVVIEVPRARRQLRPVHINGNPKTGTYRRDHSGDYLCGADEVAAMYRDAADEPLDAAVLDDVGMDALCGETVRTYRRSYDLHHGRNAWSKLDDEGFLCRIGAAGRGCDGEIHPTKAGLLVFGEEWRIQPEFPHYFLDYRQETSPEARWQDRVTSQTAGEWSGNVFDFFQRAYEKMRQALRVPFRLDGNGRRVDETPAHDALREAIANCLVNADYDGRRGVVLLWREDGFRLSNPAGSASPSRMPTSAGTPIRATHHDEDVQPGQHRRARRQRRSQHGGGLDARRLQTTGAERGIQPRALDDLPAVGRQGRRVHFARKKPGDSPLDVFLSFDKREEGASPRLRLRARYLGVVGGRSGRIQDDRLPDPEEACQQADSRMEG